MIINQGKEIKELKKRIIEIDNKQQTVLNFLKKFMLSGSFL